MSELEESYPFRWYCVATNSAAEARVALRIGKFCEVMGWTEYFDSYLIPLEPVVITEPGKPQVLKKERMFAGYFFIRCKLTPNMREMITSIAGVVSFVGDREGSPQPVPESQITGLIQSMIESRSRSSKPHLPKGTKVIITEGPFQNFVGVIDEYEGHNKVRVICSIFGRTTRISFDETIVTPEDKIKQSA